ncbi:MAG TPA: hypothetical protein VEP91_11820 [Solirubrobacterales bacterium]|nr:hypothetical protein [Solirubrobacterales bacterium]
MRRKMWTDERLTERFNGLDKRLDRIDADIRDLRALMIQLWGSTIIGSLGVIATLVVTR